ncbi:MAG: SusD/RagB family nutrient-binding outer membrane lipoprotein [Saprospiraceae bacterium]|nr:SusD/RagB family nutrient-binding outer membrane lipoprotein [Saprospiraceae bacterium]
MKIYNYIVFSALLVLSLEACTKFEVINENPDVATSINNNPELLLTNAQRNSINRVVGDAWSEGNLMAQYGARIVFTEFDLFNWGTQSGTWESHYLTIRDLEALRQIAENTGNDSYEAVALIMQSWLFQILTDMWGDIPFSEAAKANAEDPIFQPRYDKQQDIYQALLTDLEKANSLLAGSGLPKIKGDILFAGDLVRWRKFANSLRLRVALRLSEADPSTAQSVIAQIAANPAEYPVMESNDDNAVLTFLTANPNAHPVTEESVYRVGSYNEYRISETMVGILREFDDPRLQFFADPTATSVIEGNPVIEGMQNGIVDGPAYTYKGGDPFLSKFNINYFYFQPNANQGRLMTFSEVMFILAEAAQRGWIDEDAALLYNNGITANFTYWNVDLPSDYLQRPSVVYDNSLEKIMKQKYLALFYTDYQGFIEFKRTGYPSQIAPGPDALYSEYPSRFLYQTKEIALNRGNYDEAVSRQGPDVLLTKVWWEK